MSWAPRYDYSPEAGSPTEEFFLDGDYIEPMGSPRITVGIQETMQLQRSLEPNFNGSQAWSPFVDAEYPEVNQVENAWTDVDGSAPPAPAIREADAYRHITPGPRSIQAIPLQNGVHSRATEASFRAIQPIRIPMNALTPGNRMLADNHIPQVDAQQVFDQKMAPTRKRKRRQFSPTEKEHIKRVRKLGACPECRLKKCK
ncbi:MAG: hypothetical protein Q9198_005369, partial [Flavoplaca austrocitrina]